jgi:hypothetical protein
MDKEVKSVEYGLEKIFEGAQDFLPLLGTDYRILCRKRKTISSLLYILGTSH